MVGALSRSGRERLRTPGDGGEVVGEGGVGFLGSLESQLPCPLTFMLVRQLAWGAVISRMGLAVM